MLSYNTFTLSKDIGFVSKIPRIGTMLVMSCESQASGHSQAHGDHGCGDGSSNVWRMLASLVTEGLQLTASGIVARSWRAFDFLLNWRQWPAYFMSNK